MLENMPYLKSKFIIKPLEQYGFDTKTDNRSLNKSRDICMWPWTLMNLHCKSRQREASSMTGTETIDFL